MVFAEALCVFVARAVATSFRALYLPHDVCNEEEGSEPSVGDLIGALVYACGMLVVMSMWIIRFNMNRALVKQEDDEAAVHEAAAVESVKPKRCVPPWEEASTVATELIAWASKDASLLGFALVYAALYPKPDEEGEEPAGDDGSGSGETPEEETDISWPAIVTHLLYGCALLLLGALLLLALPPLLETVTQLVRATVCRLMGTAERFAALSKETKSEVRHAGAVKAAVAAVALSTAYHFSSAFTSAILHLCNGSPADVVGYLLFFAYVLLLSCGGGMLLAALPAETLRNRYGRFLERCLGLLAGWGISEISARFHDIGGVHEALGKFIGAVLVTLYCFYVTMNGASVRVRRRVWRKTVSSHQATKISSVLVVASVLAVRPLPSSTSRTDRAPGRGWLHEQCPSPTTLPWYPKLRRWVGRGRSSPRCCSASWRTVPTAVRRAREVATVTRSSSSGHTRWSSASPSSPWPRVSVSGRSARLRWRRRRSASSTRRATPQARSMVR